MGSDNANEETCSKIAGEFGYLVIPFALVDGYQFVPKVLHFPIPSHRLQMKITPKFS